MPLAVPLMDSSGASVLKTTVLTPLGSLKLKLMGAAISRLPEPNRTARGVILLWKAICGYDSRPGDAVSSQFTRRSVRVPSGGQGLTDGGGPSSAQQKAPALRTCGPATMELEWHPMPTWRRGFFADPVPLLPSVPCLPR